MIHFKKIPLIKPLFSSSFFPLKILFFFLSNNAKDKKTGDGYDFGPKKKVGYRGLLLRYKLTFVPKNPIKGFLKKKPSQSRGF